MVLGLSFAVCVKLKGSVTDDLRACLVLVGGEFQEAGHDGPAQEYAKAAEVNPPGWDVVQVSVVVGVVLDRHGYEVYEVGCGGVRGGVFLVFYGRLVSVTIISRTELILRGRDDDRLIVWMRRYIKYLL